MLHLSPGAILGALKLSSASGWRLAVCHQSRHSRAQSIALEGQEFGKGMSCMLVVLQRCQASRGHS